MSKFNHNDINDDEIRIITPQEGKRESHARKGLKPLIWAIVIIAVLIIAGAIILYKPAETPPEFVRFGEDMVTQGKVSTESVDKPFVERRDTLVDGVELMIFTPRNATPVLEIGNGVVQDTTAVLVAQAADIRNDNGEIVGAFVLDGELISKGEAKAGFCSIINGEISIGVADASPMFEQALTGNGYFFRQFPLVVGGQIVENQSKSSALRKALAEIDGKICVVITNNKVTFTKFSQALIDAGVRNAIYLVGANAYGRYRDLAGKNHTFGTPWPESIRYVNYLVWR